MNIKALTPILLVLVALTGWQSAAASEQDGQWYINGLGTAINADSDRAVDDGFGGGTAAVGVAISERFNIEFTGQYLDLDGEGGGPDTEQTALGLNLMPILNRQGTFSPYGLLGAGWVQTDLEGGDDASNFQFQSGVGLLTDLFSERFYLRTEAVYRWEDGDSGRQNFNDWLFNVGLGVALGNERTRTMDSDGDGVPDGEDRCPGTVPGAVVDAFGCERDTDSDGVVDRQDECPTTPRGATVDPRGCPADADGDGVYNGLDQCPDTLAGATVDGVGCPMDSDGDGVYDGRDECPNSIRGALVDRVGCEFRLSGINFPTNAAEPLPSGTIRLDQAAARLKDYPDVRIVVEGHTDSDGRESYNLQLSQQRAQAVKDYLVSRGVAARRIRTVGLGESQPIADNSTEAGKAKNRRVVLRVEE